MTSAPMVTPTEREPQLRGQTVVVAALTGAFYDVDGGQQLV
jgi:hypothetical protein